LAAALLLEVAVFAMRGLARLIGRLHAVPEESRAGEIIGGDVWAGIRRTLASPYLLNIALFLALFSITATFLYFEQAAVA
ncbi:hypothetical protein, partial [Vibrio cholerae]